MSNEDKLYEVDTFLAMCEDFMHGKDGADVTKCRRLVNEVIKELSKLHQPTVIVCLHPFNEVVSGDDGDFCCKCQTYLKSNRL
jgi:hypothetical protein